MKPKDYSNHESLKNKYGHMIGSLIEFTNQRTKEKTLGLITDIVEHKSWDGAPAYSCFKIEFIGNKINRVMPTISEVLHNPSFRVIS